MDVVTGGESFSGLISAASQVNFFIVTGGLLGLAGIVAKFFIKTDQGTVKFLGKDIPLNYLWIFMTVLSLLHIYYSWHLLVEITRILQCDDRQLSKAAWEKLTDDADERRVLYNLAERTPIDGPIPFSNVTEMSGRDSLMLLHAFLILSVATATIRWLRTDSWRVRILTTLVALLLLFVNWTAGSQWALLASDLARHGRGESQKMTDLRETVVAYSGATCRR